MFGCRRFRIEVRRCPRGNFHVSIQPVEYVGKPQFREWMKFCRRNFMSLTARWRWERVFHTHEEAVRFAKHLARTFGEAVFLNLNEVQIVAPKGEVENRI